MNDRAAALPLLGVLAPLMGFCGYVDAVNAAAAPFLAREFGLDDSGVAAVFAWVALGAVASLPIARAADRIGRRRVLLASALALSPLALASAAAPLLWAFVIFQVGVQALKGALMNLIPVMVAEALPTERRASGQARIGLAASLGAGLALILVAACADLPGSWRWGWAAAGLSCVAVPFARRLLSESVHFSRASASGETLRSRARELLGRRYRRRTLGVLAVVALFPMAVAGTQGWVIYHPVKNLGLDPWLATAVVLAGGGAGLAGFPLGSRFAELWGRRHTFAVSGIVYVVAAVAFYSVPADFAPSPALGVGLAFAVMGTMSAAASVPVRAAATELFPTRLRGAISGWLAIGTALAVVAINFAVAGLAHALGGLAPAASLAALTMLGAVAAFLWLLPETTGLDLEQAALEGPEADA